jgi:hypothetical protein
VKNHLKKLIAKDRVKPVFKIDNEGRLFIVAYERRSGLSKKKKQTIFLDNPIEVQIKGGNDEKGSETSEKI